jgi:integrase
MPKALTTRTIESFKPGPSRKEIADAHMPGLYLVLQPSGARSWAVRYRHAARSRKYTIGAYPAIDLKSARALGAKALRAAAEGRDPGREKLQARAIEFDSIETVTGKFIERHCRQANRPRTAEETERLLRLHVLPRWRGRKVGDIARRDVLDVLDRVVEAGAPIAANRTLAAVRKLFSWCIARDIVAASPCAGVKPPTPERSRDRVLSHDELRVVWQAAGKIGWPFGPLVKLLMLTGQRRDEVAGMRWPELDLTARLWTLPRERVKNNRPHQVPLSELAVAVLAPLPRFKNSPFVFTTTGTTPSTGYSKGKRRLDALLPPDMPDWRLHDLRRTFATGLQNLGVPLEVTEKILNHTSGSFAGIVRVYQTHAYATEKRSALDAWGRFVADLVGAPAPRKRRAHA